MYHQYPVSWVIPSLVDTMSSHNHCLDLTSLLYIEYIIKHVHHSRLLRQMCFYTSFTPVLRAVHSCSGSHNTHVKPEQAPEHPLSDCAAGLRPCLSSTNHFPVMVFCFFSNGKNGAGMRTVWFGTIEIQLAFSCAVAGSEQPAGRR